MPATFTLARFFLLIAGVMWLAYGVYILMSPETLAAIAGVSATSTTGTIELRAMYGGLEAAVGVLALTAAFVASLRKTGLGALAFICAGMGATRLLCALLAQEFSKYTVQGLTLEIPLAIIAIWLFAREP